MPELVVTCKKQWDLFVNRFNLVQRGKESKLVGKENKTSYFLAYFIPGKINYKFL